MDFYRINSLFYPLILERAIRSSMSRYHPCPRPILASLVVIRTKGSGGREEGGSIEGGGSGLCLPPSSARFQSWRTRMEESAG